jgi:hypothetical protein
MTYSDKFMLQFPLPSVPDPNCDPCHSQPITLYDLPHGSGISKGDHYTAGSNTRPEVPFYISRYETAARTSQKTSPF